jgi:hypothetical protein
MVALVAAGGCWSTAPRMDYAKAGLVRVAGTVRLAGRPLPGALVTFEDPETGMFSHGRTDDDGRYSLMFDSRQAGVTKGHKVVRIRTAGSIGEDDPDAGPTRQELVPSCYNKDTKLVAEVTGNSSATDFDLASDCGE